MGEIALYMVLDVPCLLFEQRGPHQGMIVGPSFSPRGRDIKRITKVNLGRPSPLRTQLVQLTLCPCVMLTSKASTSYSGSGYHRISGSMCT